MILSVVENEIIPGEHAETDLRSMFYTGKISKHTFQALAIEESRRTAEKIIISLPSNDRPQTTPLIVPLSASLSRLYHRVFPGSKQTE